MISPEEFIELGLIETTAFCGAPVKLINVSELYPLNVSKSNSKITSSVVSGQENKGLSVMAVIEKSGVAQLIVLVLN